MQRVLVTLALMSLLAGLAFAGGEVFDFTDELAKGYDRPAFRVNEVLRTPEYTVAVFTVKDEIKTHQHTDASHVLYVTSGHGTVTLDGKPFPLQPGTIVHIPPGVSHSLKAEGGELTRLDFSAHTPATQHQEQSRPGIRVTIGTVVDTTAQPRYTRTAGAELRRGDTPR